MRGLALNFASTHQTENPQGFSEVGENKQLLIANVVHSLIFFQFFVVNRFLNVPIKVFGHYIQFFFIISQRFGVALNNCTNHKIWIVFENIMSASFSYNSFAINFSINKFLMCFDE
ncbi:hypothetical protein C7H52_11180 [Aurantibacter aestuarii]|uniref:Uncharacterized protein n=1 Tax=Aurantibacter aestuarii TaxID=1266046 RepID=A0A2T1N6T9_9FLAO|nr:hypothetical protein C7H52_11180 [Aurantibacter aestuarii]